MFLWLLIQTILKISYSSPDAGELCLNNGCCGAGARTRLTQQARSQLEGALRSELNKLADILSSKAKRFDGKSIILLPIYAKIYFIDTSNV